jgi:hypothetical protein
VWNDAELAGHNPRDGCHVVWIRRKTDAAVVGFESAAESAEAWSQVPVEFKRALALRSEIRRGGWFN